jgi:hypothetical protein
MADPSSACLTAPSAPGQTAVQTEMSVASRVDGCLIVDDTNSRSWADIEYVCMESELLEACD